MRTSQSTWIEIDVNRLNVYGSKQQQYGLVLLTLWTLDYS